MSSADSAVEVLTVPGWHGSGIDHWQSLWEAAHGYRRVQQHDWERPLRGDWSARLEDEVLACQERGRPVVLAAHSLGCVLVAAWAQASRHAGAVRAALLVAPADADSADLRARLHGWAPVAAQALPFVSTVVASSDDPYCSLDRARQLARAWGSRFVEAGPHGHLNAASNLGEWPAGLALLGDTLRAAGLAWPAAHTSRSMES